MDSHHHQYRIHVYKCLVKYLDMLMQSEDVEVVQAARLWADHITSISEEVGQIEKVELNDE